MDWSLVVCPHLMSPQRVAWKAGIGAPWERDGAPKDSYFEDGSPFSPHLIAPLDFHTCSFSLSDISQLAWMTFLQNLVLSYICFTGGFEIMTVNDHITLRTQCAVSGTLLSSTYTDLQVKSYCPEGPTCWADPGQQWRLVRPQVWGIWWELC